MKINRKMEVWWPVEISVPRDGGTVELVQGVELRLRIADLTKKFDNDVEHLVSVVTNWKGIEDESGATIEFSEENLRSLCSMPFILKGFTQALLRSCAGVAAKN